MAEPQIKPDPDAGSSFVDEVDETPDLEFYDKLPDADAYSRMYLTRLPNYVWEAWSKLDDDEEIEIGTIRQWMDETGKTRLQMRLKPDLPPHTEVPKEYDMEVTNHDVNNTFVFTEQDLPSYAAKNKERANALAQGIPAHLLRKQQRQMEPPAERGRKGAPYSRRPIPKKTRIAGKIKHEVVCTPVRNAEADRFLSIRAEAAQKPQKTVTMLRGFPTGDTTNPNEWESFLKTREKPTKAKKMENKATRWPENQLLDAIAKCFSEHKYWSIKAFRGRIPQPEAYLRETLDKVAVLHRSGTFANHWSLKPEYEGILASLPKPADDAAVPKADIPSDDEEDEDIKMEDVI
ncbi:transcription initiation factor IIF, beta subunit-domain-containing protein [Corynascus novoguineensis]|uniref:Transcription initiation factor IIF subunit beta n=1 Tax=Corynascus novoguineensis TaxID=1126955 RepID=A0AAN7CJK0_9PEZI|nr:transcription initiation factor IIF, beta subunit-domain-containing protein [Corynascus novoguineensis]